MSWGGGWDQARCEAVDGAGVRCALAPGHGGEHRTAAGIAESERSAGAWRMLFVGVAIAASVAFAWIMAGR